MSYSQKIKELCKAKKITVTKLEQELGFGNGYISTLKDKIPTDRAMRIADYLGLPADYFMPTALKKDSAPQNPIVGEILVKAGSLSPEKQKELLDYVEFLLQKG